MRKIICLFLTVLIVLFPFACASEAMTVAAKGAALIDGASGRVLFGQNENEMFPEASCTKIMTALLALENAALDEEVTTGKNASGVEGTSIYLAVGESLSMEHMLYGLMLRSGNDAAVAIAEHVAGSVPAFAEMMNARARELNADAHFVNPNGLDAQGHKASALGLARIMREAMKNPDFRTITGTQKKIIPWVGNEYSRVLENKNRLLRTYEGATGGKTGFTSKAGRCLVFSAKREEMELIGCVLNCPTWFDTATAMLDYGFENYHMELSLTRGQTAAQVTVLDGSAASVNAIAKESLTAAVKNGAKVEIVTDTEPLTAPVEKGTVVGRSRLLSDGIVLAEIELIAATDVPKWNLLTAVKSVLSRWLIRMQAQTR